MLRRWKMKWTEEPAAPYSRLAEIYDYVMRHVDYEHWADYIRTIFNRYEKKPTTILELACGTGSLAFIFAGQGYRITGVDRSDAMIAAAQEKARAGGQDITFLQGDMSDPPVDGPFDAALCLYDSINYLMDIESMLRMMAGVRTCLKPGGLFIFDACTEINSRRYFNRQTQRESTDDFTYIRRSEYLAKERIQVNEFQLLLRHGSQYGQHFERHEQRIYPITQMLETCRTSGFEILGAFDGFSFTPATEKSNRVHFVLSPADPS